MTGSPAYLSALSSQEFAVPFALGSLFNMAWYGHGERHEGTSEKYEDIGMGYT